MCSAYQSIQLGRVVMQDHMGQLRGAFAADLSILHHSSQRNGQSFAPRLCSLPANLLPVDLWSVRIEIGAEEDLLRIPLQEIAYHLAQSPRGDQPGLL